MNHPEHVLPSPGEIARLPGIDQYYRHLPSIYFFFLIIWTASVSSWTFNTYQNRRFQTNKLQWALTSVPLIKALQLTLSSIFWCSCYYHQVCSLWMSFGVYVTGVLLQTASFVCFLLISHGYCIICERLSVSERRTTVALGCVFYLTLIGQRASVPAFPVLLLLCYSISFYLIFHLISQNLRVLRDQLTITVDDDVRAMHEAINTKYAMFKKFKCAMQAVVIAETMIFIYRNDSMEHYWVRICIRECTHFCIFLYIGWVFRSQALAPRFSVMPTVKSKVNAAVPPIYSIEMDAESFGNLRSHDWHLGVQSLHFQNGDPSKPVLVLVQHPHAYKPYVRLYGYQFRHDLSGHSFAKDLRFGSHSTSRIGWRLTLPDRAVVGVRKSVRAVVINPNKFTGIALLNKRAEQKEYEVANKRTQSSLLGIVIHKTLYMGT
ncbi:unnamed protein product [Rhodiola kirilowii]